jgi:hypothetical protein
VPAPLPLKLDHCTFYLNLPSFSQCLITLVLPLETMQKAIIVMFFAFSCFAQPDITSIVYHFP